MADTSPHWQRLARVLTHHLTLTHPITLAEARQRLTYHLRIAAAGWHVVEAYEACVSELPKVDPS